MRYIRYRPDTGRITQDGFCADDALEDQALDGDLVMAHETASYSTHWVDNGVVTEYSPEAKLALANPPGPGFKWSPAQGAWADQRLLSQARADAWQAIKRRREQAFAARAVSSASIAYSIAADKANLADRLASLQAAIAIGAADSTTSITWRDRDNAEHALTIAGLNLLAAEMGARGQAIYERSWALDAQVQAATSNAQLTTIDYDGGWP